MQNFETLINLINQTHSVLKSNAAFAVNVSLTVRNWLVGYYIVNYEQNGNDRARYGEKTVKKLSENLNSKDGFSYRNLQLYKQFFVQYQNLLPAIQSFMLNIGDNAKNLSKQLPSAEILKNENISMKTEEKQIMQSPIAQFKRRNDLSLDPDRILSKLSYTHFVQLLAIDDPLKRVFYEIECIRGTWNVRELQRQIYSSYFERSGLSQNKEKLSDLVHLSSSQLEPNDIIQSPFMFEFLGLNTSALVTETELEQALIDNLKNFLLELGYGFCFEARQKRILIGDEYFFVDLVFYHRVLKCHVLIELKNDKFKQHYISQLDTYLNYYREEVRLPEDNPPVGILLCTHKNNALVKYATASLDKNIFVQKYLLKLPATEEIEEYIKKLIK
jgi:predicted nuclease of restriction endonuclease-like (RecB) superfamily